MKLRVISNFSLVMMFFVMGAIYAIHGPSEFWTGWKSLTSITIFIVTVVGLIVFILDYSYEGKVLKKNPFKKFWGFAISYTGFVWLPYNVGGLLGYLISSNVTYFFL